MVLLVSFERSEERIMGKSYVGRRLATCGCHKKNENNSKALFRKAKAQAELGYIEKAEKILETLARKSPAG